METKRLGEKETTTGWIDFGAKGGLLSVQVAKGSRYMVEASVDVPEDDLEPVRLRSNEGLSGTMDAGPYRFLRVTLEGGTGRARVDIMPY